MASENGVHVDPRSVKMLMLDMPDGSKYKAVPSSGGNRCHSCGFARKDCSFVQCPPEEFVWEKVECETVVHPHEELKTLDDVRSHNVGDLGCSKHTGSKYHRQIRDIKGRQCMVFDSEREEYMGAVIDVYNVLDAFDVRKPALQHGSKKMLCAGIRGKGDLLQDLIEARDAVTRQIDELQNK